MQRQEEQAPVANIIEAIEKIFNELQGILRQGIGALKIKKNDTFCKELVQFLEKEIIKNKLEEFQDTITGLKDDPTNKFLQAQIEEEILNLTDIVKVKLRSVEAKQNGQANAKMCISVLQKLLTCLTPAINLDKEITNEAIHNLLTDKLTALAGEITSLPAEEDAESEISRQQVRPVSCFISYAWGVKEHEKLAKKLHENLTKAGLQATIDIRNNQASSSVNYFTEEILEVDHVVLMGSQNLMRKYYEDREIYKRLKAAHDAGDNETVRRLEKDHNGYIVNQELDMILARKGSNPFAILPVLVDGTLKECLPPEFSRMIPVYFTKWEDEKHYCLCVFEVLEHLLSAHKPIVEKYRNAFFKLITDAGELPGDIIKELEEERQQKLAADQREAREILINTARRSGQQASATTTTTTPVKPQPTGSSTRLFGQSGRLTEGVSRTRREINIVPVFIS